MFCQYCLNVRNLHVCGTLADIKDGMKTASPLQRKIGLSLNTSFLISFVSVWNPETQVLLQWCGPILSYRQRKWNETPKLHLMKLDSKVTMKWDARATLDQMRRQSYTWRNKTPKLHLIKWDAKVTLNEIGFQSDNEMRCQSYTWSNEMPKLYLIKWVAKVTLNEMRHQSYTYWNETPQVHLKGRPAYK